MSNIHKDTKETIKHKKNVKFSNNVTIKYVDYSNLQCLQQYYDDYDICKKQFIEYKYIQSYGSFYKFELEKYNKEEQEYELHIGKELKVEKNTLNFYNNGIISDSDSDSDNIEYIYIDDNQNK
jgi:hypothetical protein